MDGFGGVARRVPVFDDALEAHFTGVSNIILVDMFTGFDPSTYMPDDVHPNALGETFMAERWYAALVPFLNN